MSSGSVSGTKAQVLLVSKAQALPGPMSRLISGAIYSLRPFVLRGLLWSVLLLIFLAGLLGAVPVAADGQVFSPVPPRERGLQVDSAVFSPQPEQWAVFESDGSASEPAIAAGETYVVQPGDTLSQIAARFQVDMDSLVSANGLDDPDHIEVGQRLRLALPATGAMTASADGESRAGESSGPDAQDGGDLLRVQVWPWPPVQGQTLAVWLQASRPVTFALSLDDVRYPVIGQGRRGWALVPIPALSEPGEKALTVVAGRTGVTLPIPLQAGSFDMYRIPAAVSRPILDQAQKVQAEAAQLKALVGIRSATGWTPRSRFSSPLEGDYPRSSPFGSRRTYEPNPAISAHEGEDFSAPAGTPVTAPAEGVVVLAEPLFVRGNAVVLDHGSGVFTGYWHLQELAVQQGDRVEAGQLLGRVGSTGLSTGAHLHWELRVGGVSVDPLQWV
jgi:murein DD-endopeptidase MepM/ murein hydrolase activator NlpD